ncbi:MAG: hypothetical protein QW514_07695 [Thermoprotei archaeon]
MLDLSGIRSDGVNSEGWKFSESLNTQPFTMYQKMIEYSPPRERLRGCKRDLVEVPHPRGKLEHRALGDRSMKRVVWTTTWMR